MAKYSIYLLALVSSQNLETFITALSSCPHPLSHVPSAHFSVILSFLALRLFASSSVLPLSLSPSLSPPHHHSLYCFTSHGSQRAVLCSVTPPSVHLFLFLFLSPSSASVVTYSHVVLLCSSPGSQHSITKAGDSYGNELIDPGCLKKTFAVTKHTFHPFLRKCNFIL